MATLNIADWAPFRKPEVLSTGASTRELWLELAPFGGAHQSSRNEQSFGQWFLMVMLKEQEGTVH